MRWAVWLLIAACSGDKVSDKTTEPNTMTGSVPEELEVTLTVSEVVGTVVKVSWSGDPGATVAYGYDGVLDRSVVATEGQSSVILVGLKAGSEVSVQVAGESMSSVEVLTLDPVPQGLPRPQLASRAGDTLGSGVVLFSLIEADGSWIVVLDADGDVVWYYDISLALTDEEVVAEGPGVDPADHGPLAPTAKFEPFSQSIAVAFYDNGQELDIGEVVRIPIAVMSADEIVETKTSLAHHDFYHHADGALAWINYVFEDYPDGRLWASDSIVEAPEGNPAAGSPVFSWHDSYPVVPWVEHELQGRFVLPTTDWEWTHTNSMMYVADEDAYFVMSKFLDCILKVDRTSGEMVYQIGGRYSDFTLPSGDPVWEGLESSALWSHAHMSELWKDSPTTGGMVVFDNGHNHPGASGPQLGWSRVVEYRFDETARTIEEVWEYKEPSGLFTGLMGDIKRLESGNYLVGWSSLGRVEELTPQGDTVWRINTALGSIPGRVSYAADLSDL